MVTWMDSWLFRHSGPRRTGTAGYWTGRTVDSLLDDAATTWPDRVAVVDDTGSHTYRELDELAEQAAGGFAALGIRPR